MPELQMPTTEAPSKLVICDRLITLAQQAERAGCRTTARRLVGLLDTMFEDNPRTPN